MDCTPVQSKPEEKPSIQSGNKIQHLANMIHKLTGYSMYSNSTPNCTWYRHVKCQDKKALIKLCHDCKSAKGHCQSSTVNRKLKGPENVFMLSVFSVHQYRVTREGKESLEKASCFVLPNISYKPISVCENSLYCTKPVITSTDSC